MYSTSKVLLTKQAVFTLLGQSPTPLAIVWKSISLELSAGTLYPMPAVDAARLKVAEPTGMFQPPFTSGQLAAPLLHNPMRYRIDLAVRVSRVSWAPSLSSHVVLRGARRHVWSWAMLSRMTCRPARP